MKKKKVTDKVNVTISYTQLATLQDWIEDWIDRYGEDAYIEIGEDDCGEDTKIIFEREETDSEYNKRVKMEQREKQRKITEAEKKKEREYREYVRLKKKFGGVDA